MAVPVLSLTEQRVVVLVAAGCSPDEIAAAVGLDKRTVEWHIARASHKLEQFSALNRRVHRKIKGEQHRDG